MQQQRDARVAATRLLLRAVAYAAIQDYEAAIDDLSTFLQIDSTSVPALWQRAVCQTRISQFQASEGFAPAGDRRGTSTDLKTMGALADLHHALTLCPQNAYLLYNRATVYALRHDYVQAIDDYTAALDVEPQLAEAYFNRGLCLIYSERITEGIADLSKAGELGLYTAYSIIKKYR